MRYAIVYVSTANKNLEKAEIKKILSSSKKWNNENDVTGLLLFSEGNFFQIIEGEKKIITDLFKNINADDRHHNILQIFGKDIHREAYDGYEADFVSDEAYFDPEKFQHYLNQIKVLDNPSQKAVENILKAFLIY
ncbi:FAD-dependent sensor of blue light [Gillisia mitskevichiae]|uniref:FAD-dependent sensor of blue light n=1 Tax=Gillisia mitskevichiae TaxID=270921 RepID=A0A495P054_9FLAO|nr:BLUF domain-containing protein [Gillisia mitskevichiae]RKS43466.1 FAD-dependent sensor of blue light [Gillisia mitskevichiae]